MSGRRTWVNVNHTATLIQSILITLKYISLLLVYLRFSDAFAQLNTKILHTFLVSPLKLCPNHGNLLDLPCM
jgi:hypothetical protein